MLKTNKQKTPTWNSVPCNITFRRGGEIKSSQTNENGGNVLPVSLSRKKNVKGSSLGAKKNSIGQKFMYTERKQEYLTKTSEGIVTFKKCLLFFIDLLCNRLPKIIPTIYLIINAYVYILCRYVCVWGVYVYILLNAIKQ